MIYKTSDVLFPDRSENMHLYNSDVQVLFSVKTKTQASPVDGHQVLQSMQWGSEQSW